MNPHLDLELPGESTARNVAAIVLTDPASRHHSRILGSRWEAGLNQSYFLIEMVIHSLVAENKESK